MKCYLTGSNGYVGSRIHAALMAANHDVIELKRQNTSTPFELGKPVSSTLFSNGDALVHCAYDFSARSWEEIERVNVQGSIELFKAALASGVRRLIFISSISGFSGCRSLYGRAKLEVEKFVLENGGAVIRPGLVYGDTAGGMIGSLTKVVKNSKFVPVVGSRQKMFLVHDEDLAALVVYLISASNVPSQPVLAANPTSWEFGDILRKLAETAGTSPVFIPLPWQAVWLALKSFETIGLKLGFRSDSLIGLAYPNPEPDFKLPPACPVQFRPFK